MSRVLIITTILFFLLDNKVMSNLDEVFDRNPRHNFLPDEFKHMAHLDMPISIGFGQTNSQPSTVKQMLNWLDVQNKDKVLDVGSGSGWTSALLSTIVGVNGEIHSVEIVPELVNYGKQNIDKLGYKNVHFHQAKNNIIGWPEAAPYDKILVSASADFIPEGLLNQLKQGGRLVIPIKNSIWIYDKSINNQITKSEKPGYVFVPLIGILD